MRPKMHRRTILPSDRSLYEQYVNHAQKASPHISSICYRYPANNSRERSPILFSLNIKITLTSPSRASATLVIMGLKTCLAKLKTRLRQGNPKSSGAQGVSPNRTASSEATEYPTQVPSAGASVVASQTQLPVSQRLWNQAYDSLENDSNTADLVHAYTKTITKELASDLDADIEASAASKDPGERQKHMRKWVEAGQAKIARSVRVAEDLGDVAEFVLGVKAMVDLAIQNIPQAALPWAGVCIGLQVYTYVLPIISPLNNLVTDL
jgi:hypothetical protein